MYPSRSSLRKLVLRIWFDDIEGPCVEAPLGDFFGLGHAQTYAYASQPLAVGTHGGLNSYWRMPFTKRARIEVANDGAQDCVALYYQIDYRRLSRPPRDGLRFFAAYRQAFPPEHGTPYIIMETDGGRGHFVGCNLSVEQQDEGWWGEGDDMIFVDGAQWPPTLHGTGSEDYLAQAWGMQKNAFLFNGMNLWTDPAFNEHGKVTVYRHHILDPIPFERSIRVTIEHGHANDRQGDWTSTAYWYAIDRTIPLPEIPPFEERVPYAYGGLERWPGRNRHELPW